MQENHEKKAYLFCGDNGTFSIIDAKTNEVIDKAEYYNCIYDTLKIAEEKAKKQGYQTQVISWAQKDRLDKTGNMDG